MAKVKLYETPFTAHSVVHDVPDGSDFGEWLVGEFPDGFGQPFDVYRGPINPDNLLFPDTARHTVRPHDHYNIVLRPAGGVFTGIATLIVGLGILAFIIKQLFGDDKRDPEEPAGASVVKPQDNTIRPNERIPDQYGTFRTYPDLLLPAVSYFEIDTRPELRKLRTRQIISEYMAIGAGQYYVDLTTLRQGDTPLRLRPLNFLRGAPIVSSISGPGDIYSDGTDMQTLFEPGFVLQVASPESPNFGKYVYVASINDVSGDTWMIVKGDKLQSEPTLNDERIFDIWLPYYRNATFDGNLAQINDGPEPYLQSSVTFGANVGPVDAPNNVINFGISGDITFQKLEAAGIVEGALFTINVGTPGDPNNTDFNDIHSNVYRKGRNIGGTSFEVFFPDGTLPEFSTASMTVYMTLVQPDAKQYQDASTQTTVTVYNAGDPNNKTDVKTPEPQNLLVVRNHNQLGRVDLQPPLQDTAAPDTTFTVQTSGSDTSPGANGQQSLVASSSVLAAGDVFFTTDKTQSYNSKKYFYLNDKPASRLVVSGSGLVLPPGNYPGAIPITYVYCEYYKYNEADLGNNFQFPCPLTPVNCTFDGDQITVTGLTTESAADFDAVVRRGIVMGFTAYSSATTPNPANRVSSVYMVEDVSIPSDTSRVVTVTYAGGGAVTHPNTTTLARYFVFRDQNDVEYVTPESTDFEIWIDFEFQQGLYKEKDGRKKNLDCTVLVLVYRANPDGTSTGVPVTYTIANPQGAFDVANNSITYTANTSVPLRFTEKLDISADAAAQGGPQRYVVNVRRLTDERDSSGSTIFQDDVALTRVGGVRKLVDFFDNGKIDHLPNATTSSEIDFTGGTIYTDQPVFDTVLITLEGATVPQTVQRGDTVQLIGTPIDDVYMVWSSPWDGGRGLNENQFEIRGNAGASGNMAGRAIFVHDERHTRKLTMMKVDTVVPFDIFQSPPRRLNVVATRRVRDYMEWPFDDGSTIAANLGHQVPTTKWINAFMQRATAEDGFNVPITYVDVARLQTVQSDMEAISTNMGQFNGIFSQRISSGDELQTLASNARGIMYRLGETIYVQREQEAADAVALFNRRNMSPDGPTKSMELRQANPRDGVEISYFSAANNFKEITFTYPTNAFTAGGDAGFFNRTPINPVKLKLNGITNFEQAFRRAVYEFRALTQMTDGLEMKVTEDARMLLPNDVVEVADTFVDAFCDGEVLAFSDITQTRVAVTLDQAPTGSGGGGDSITLRSIHGDETVTFPCNISLSGPNIVEFDRNGVDLSNFLAVSDGISVGTLYVYKSTTQNVVERYIIKQLSFDGSEYVNMRCINYSSDAYGADDPGLSIPNEPTPT